MITGIDFDASCWNRIKADASAWWAGELERPLLHIKLINAPAARQPSKNPYYDFQSFYDLSVPATDIVDAMDYELSRKRYAGDSFPQTLVNFGPGAIAAFLGCVLENGDGTVWCHPLHKLEISEVRLEYDKDNVWLNRIKEVMAAAVDRWQGTVQVGMTDLGGNLDTLSFFRPGEGLLFDLYDHPETVKRLTWEAHDLWWRYYNEFNAIMKKHNPGYTAWCPIFSEVPYYFLQCDFCYMIGPDMFDEFVKPELVASCKRFANSFYHLDGVGQLPHLDSLLSIPELKGIQWIPGDSQQGRQHWPDVYRKIHNAGKLIQISGGLEIFDAFDIIVEQIGTSKGLFLYSEVDISQTSKVEAFLEKYR
ncbi:MAG: hypothetical protein ACYC54_14100 [Sedimentisphaerales bacterium]